MVGLTVGLIFGVLSAGIHVLIKQRPLSLEEVIPRINPIFPILGAFSGFKEFITPTTPLAKKLATLHVSGDLYLNTHAPVRAALDRCAEIANRHPNNEEADERMERAIAAASPFIRWKDVSLQDFKRRCAIDPEAKEVIAQIDAIRAEFQTT